MNKHRENVCITLFTPYCITEEYLVWLNDSEVTKYMSTKSSDMNSLEEYCYKMMTSPAHRLFAIEVDGVHIGNITLNDIDFDRGTANTGIMIGNKKYWGTGCGTEAMKQLCDYAFGVGLNEIWLGVEAENIAAYKMYEKAGFCVTGFMMSCKKESKTEEKVGNKGGER